MTYANNRITKPSIMLHADAHGTRRRAKGFQWCRDARYGVPWSVTQVDGTPAELRRRKRRDTTGKTPTCRVDRPRPNDHQLISSLLVAPTQPFHTCNTVGTALRFGHVFERSHACVPMAKWQLPTHRYHGSRGLQGRPLPGPGAISQRTPMRKLSMGETLGFGRPAESVVSPSTSHWSRSG